MNDQEIKEAVKTVAGTIIWIAQERMTAGEPFQNVNAAVHSTELDVGDHLLDFMKEHKG